MNMTAVNGTGLSRRLLRVRSVGAIALAMTLLLARAGPAHAMQTSSGASVSIPAGQVVSDDLLVIATDFTLDGTIEGDLIVLAKTVTINGTVEGDILAVTSSAEIAGSVGDDVRMAAAFTTLGADSRVADDMLIATVAMQQLEGSEIGGDLSYIGIYGLLTGVVGAGSVTSLEEQPSKTMGGVGGSLAAGGQTVFAALWRNAVGNGSPARSASGRTALEPTAGRAAVRWVPSVSGTSWEGERLTAAQDEGDDGQAAQAGEWLADLFRRFVALLLFGLAFVRLAPRRADGSADMIAAHPFKSLLWGLVSVPTLVMIGLVITFGSVVAVVVERALTLNDLVGLTILAGITAMMMLVVAAIALVSYMAFVVVGMWLGRLALRKGGAHNNLLGNPYVQVSIGTLVVAILTALPYVGLALAVVTALLGLGSLWLLWRDDLLARWVLQERESSEPEPGQELEATA
jgi:cytoskeletal protein CcmA (bactofilin family)